jgi:hypothetical protein
MNVRFGSIADIAAPFRESPLCARKRTPDSSGDRQCHQIGLRCFIFRSCRCSLVRSIWGHPPPAPAERKYRAGFEPSLPEETYGIKVAHHLFDRRTVLKGAAAAGALQVASPFIIAARGETPIRIGMVDPFTGFMPPWRRTN